MTKPRSVLSLAAVLLTMAAMAIPSGALFLMDTSGSILGGQFILPRLSAILPFVSDFTLVAVWLLSVFGALPIAISVALMKSARWAWKAGAVLGAIEVSWIIVEIIMFFDLGFTPMYPLFGGIGLLTIVASLNPSLRRFLSTAPVKFGP